MNNPEIHYWSQLHFISLLTNVKWCDSDICGNVTHRRIHVYHNLEESLFQFLRSEDTDDWSLLALRSSGFKWLPVINTPPVWNASIGMLPSSILPVTSFTPRKKQRESTEHLARIPTVLPTSFTPPIPINITRSSKHKPRLNNETSLVLHGKRRPNQTGQ